VALPVYVVCAPGGSDQLARVLAILFGAAIDGEAWHRHLTLRMTARTASACSRPGIFTVEGDGWRGT
jgi:hypothetical protein